DNATRNAFIGDAGYTLSTNMMTPQRRDGSRREKLQHSETRFAVSRSLGMLKEKWRILRRVLNMQTPESCERTIVACIVCIIYSLIVPADDSGLEYQKDAHLGRFHRFTSRVSKDPLEKRDRIKDLLVESNRQ
ncbi:hypothetical protein BVRB_033280, partial [Beta vulgaris subsp. vulgaris]